MMADCKTKGALTVQFVAFMAALVASSQARSLDNDGVIPSPNQEFGDELASLGATDLQRMSSLASSKSISPLTNGAYKPEMSIEPQQQQEHRAEASNEASVPIYVSPFNRVQRGATIATPVAPSSQMPSSRYEHSQESSHAPPNYAPTPASSASSSDDLKTSASYGHHHHGGHYGHEPSGWLDMGAWTGGKGSFGWYADYPVGGGKHHGYGKK